ncbi:hypothetical protein MTO96_002475 [Rhipicephalus appendiculatus]
MYYTEIQFLTAAKSHILETLVMGEALVGLTFFWFIYNTVAVVKEFSFSNFGVFVLTTLVLGPMFGKLVGHLLAYLLIALSQDVSNHLPGLAVRRLPDLSCWPSTRSWAAA